MLSKLLRTMLPAVEPWVVPGENVENPGGIMNANPLDTLSSEYHEWGNRVRFLALLPFPHPSTGRHNAGGAGGAVGRVFVGRCEVGRAGRVVQGRLRVRPSANADMLTSFSSRLALCGPGMWNRSRRSSTGRQTISSMARSAVQRGPAAASGLAEGPLSATAPGSAPRWPRTLASVLPRIAGCECSGSGVPASRLAAHRRDELLLAQWRRA